MSFLLRVLSVLLGAVAIGFTAYPTYKIADDLGHQALRAGWGQYVKKNFSTMPMFLIGCQTQSRCGGPFLKALEARFERWRLFATAPGMMVALLIYLFTLPIRKQKYNARWGNAFDFAGRMFSQTSPKLALGLQLAHAWKTYPAKRKNRHGFLEVMDWGRREGKFGGRVVAVVPQLKRKELGHVLVVGPTRCGKGLALTQNLLCFAGSVAVNDPKGENFARTGAWRKAMGQDVRVIDPRGRGDKFNPFFELSRKPETLKMACRLIADPEGDGGESIFAERGSSALYAGMRAAFLADEPVLTYLRFVTRNGLLGFIEEMSHVKDAEVQQNLTDFLGFACSEFSPREAMQDRFLTSCWSTITARLFPLFSPGILASASGSDFYAEDLVMKPTSLYLCFAETDLEFTKTYLQLVWLSITSSLIEVGDRLMGDTPQRVLFGLDEAGVVPIPRLPQLLATIAGRGMSAMIYVQDEQQLAAAYGEEGAHVIITNCDAQVYYAPRDFYTQKNLSQRCGQITLGVQHRSRTDGKLSVRWASEERELLTPDEARQMHMENVIVIYGNNYPLLGRRLNFTKHPYWKKAQGLPRLELNDLSLPKFVVPPTAKADVPYEFPV
jgi:type IV secretion system protein VirD4